MSASQLWHACGVFMLVSVLAAQSRAQEDRLVGIAVSSGGATFAARENGRTFTLNIDGTAWIEMPSIPGQVGDPVVGIAAGGTIYAAREGGSVFSRNLLNEWVQMPALPVQERIRDIAAGGLLHVLLESGRIFFFNGPDWRERPAVPGAVAIKEVPWSGVKDTHRR